MDIRHLVRREQFYHCYQPIYRLDDWTKVGFEALLRTDLHLSPEFIFNEARKQKKLYELDSRSIHKAVLTSQSAGLSKNDGILFINLYPTTILNPGFPSFLSKIMTESNCKSQQIVIELLESEDVDDFDALKSQIHQLKKQGFLIAIDDVGKGYTDFRRIFELETDFIKLDRYFAHELHLSDQKQSLVSFFLTYCSKHQNQLILEGLENASELTMAKALGIPFGQGYLLGEPQPLLPVGSVI